MALSLVDADILVLLVITLNAAVLSRNSSQDDLMPNDQQGSSNNNVQKGCPNWQGMLVADGEKYVPNGNDMCMQCTCDKGFPIMCHSVACSPPLQCSSPQQVKDACCEYICLDDKVHKDRNVTDNSNGTEKGDAENITNLSLRLIASTVTSFLVLALLLFMVHRLRQRRLLLAMRRFENQSRQGQTDDTDSDPYIPDAYLSLECPPYTDPPPPYSPPKPPQIFPGEQPPPYDEINHNIDESHADENRNQIRGVTSSSNFVRSVQGNTAGQRMTNSRNHAQVENDADCLAVHQRRSFELRHQRSGNDNLRPPNTLPAYASTDVVEGLGVVISPGSDMVCYSAGWNSWRGAHDEANRQAVQSEARQQRSPHRGSFSSSFGPNGSRVQTLPTTTAFQRFSNIFRRDSWKMKHWRHHGRPVSDYSTPPHYATIPRNEQSPRSGIGCSRPQTQGKNMSRPFSSGFPDTLCLSYDTGQVTYTLGAISPSTSSSNSSEHFDQNNTVNITVCSTTTSTTPGASSSGNSISPPDGSCLMGSDFLLSPAHRQQFHDDLCRHLPPLQLSDIHEVATSDVSESACVSSSASALTEGISNKAIASQCSKNVVSVLSFQHVSGQTFMDSVCSRETNLLKARQVPSNLTTTVTSNSSSTSCTDHHNSGQQSLASFIRSHPSVSAMENKDQTSFKGIAPLHSLLRSNCHVIPPTSGECPQVLSCSSSQAYQQYIPSVPQGNSSLTQGHRNSRELSAAIQETRNTHELTSRQETRSGRDIAAETKEIKNSHEMAATQYTRNNQDVQATSDHLLELAQHFPSLPQTISPFFASLPPEAAAVVSTTFSTSQTFNIPPIVTATALCATSPSSPSPSPPPASAASAGALRRSQSGASQASMFSVCSETGEKKLKGSNILENDMGIISPNSCYSDHHHSLSRPRPYYYQEPQCVPAVMSMLPLDAPGVFLTEMHDHITSDNPGSYSTACGSKCQLNTDFHTLFSQEYIASPMTNSNTVSGGLVSTAAFPCCVSSTSSHPSTISNSSLLSSCGGTLTYPANGPQTEDTWNSSNYNFNSLAEFDKSVPVKNVPSLYEEDRMTQSVNIPPLPPFNTAQSTKILKHVLPSNDDPSTLSKPGKSHEALKKLKKKRAKDRSLSSPQFCNTARHTASSPKHHCFKVSDWNKEAGFQQKSESTLKDKEAMVRVLRPGDKKHRGHSSATRQHVKLCDPVNCNKIMTRSAGDAPAVYGNADVYRSIGGEGLGTALSYQQQTFVPWNQQGATGGCDNSFSFGTAINDLNQPPNYLKAQVDNSSPSHAVSGSDGPNTGKGDLRKKGGHKRQSSAGEKAGHISSPNRYKSRPKSLAAPDVHLNDKRAEVILPRLSLTTSDFGLVGKGARSGFGHDLNFDDQNGIADLHIQEVDFGNRRISLVQDGHTQSSVGPTRKLSRVDGICESSNVPTKVNNASFGYHPGSRSGLSNELSFTSRPTLTSGQTKKRQSLPTGIGGALYPGTQDRASVGSNIASRSRQSEEGHIHVNQVKGERSSCISERRMDKPVYVDDYIEATSYV